MSGYCLIAPGHPVHAHYHDHEYGFPVASDQALFQRMALEIMQAGLSWEIVLKKRATLNQAFDNFNITTVAAYGDADIERLLANAGIIRNRLKVLAIIENAKRILKLLDDYQSFSAWIDAHHPKTLPEWIKLFKKTFKFTGGEIVNEFLMSTGYLPGAHAETCPVYQKVLNAKPAWLL